MYKIKVFNLPFGFTCLLLFVIFALPSFSAPGSDTLRTSYVSVILSPDDGQYILAYPGTGWRFRGGLDQHVIISPVIKGKDGIGRWAEILMTPVNQTFLYASIRVYEDKEAVLFTIHTDKQIEKFPIMFPDFTSFPKGLKHFSHQNSAFSPPVFSLVETGTPWLFFDERDNSCIISPANRFMIASMYGDGISHISSGLNKSVRDLPAGFSYSTIMVTDHGIGNNWRQWGNTLTDFYHKVRPSDESGIGLQYFGYWTDNGAKYYYRYDTALGYAGTLEKVATHYRERDIPLGYIQLDSWWYPKALAGTDGLGDGLPDREKPPVSWKNTGGLVKYEPDPFVFPGGLRHFSEMIRLPLITHNRWIAPSSPYRQQYHVSGFGITDPVWWDHIGNFLTANHIICYEQDWLDRIYNRSPEFSSRVGVADSFMNNMAASCSRHGINIQYCMPLPRHILQASKYSNVTTFRASNDRFDRGKWDDFLFNSQYGNALGIWPWTDVFYSRETGNLILSDLSAGMVGIGDAIGDESKENIFKAIRADGKIIKPDAAIVPTDETYIARCIDEKAPMVAYAYTRHADMTTYYVFTYTENGGEKSVSFTPSSFGATGMVAIYDKISNSFTVVVSDSSYTANVPDGHFDFYEVASFNKNGIAFLGDKDKFVGTGRERIEKIEDKPHQTIVWIMLAGYERYIVVHGVAEHAPSFYPVTGKVISKHYNMKSGYFTAKLYLPGGSEERSYKVIIK